MSRQLRSLLKQNRVLEEKLFYDPRVSDWRENVIDSTELSEALSLLSNQIIANKSQQLSVLEMLNEVKKIDGRPLSPYEKNAMQVVEILFNYLREYSNFAPEYFHILNSLQLAFTRLSLNDLSFLDNDKHTAVKFLVKLVKLGHHFDKDAGKLAQFFVKAIELLTDRLANRANVTNETFISASKKLDEYFNGFNDKTTANINRIFNQVEKESRMAQADLHTKKLIKSKTEGEEIPIFLLNFYEEQLIHILHHTIGEYGAQSKQCQGLLTDMDTLSWSITYPLSDEEYRQRFEADVSDAMKRLYQQFECQQRLNESVKAFFVETEELHHKKLNGERVSYDVMISADIFDDELDDDVEDDDLWADDKVDMAEFVMDSLKEGNWYRLDLPDGVIQGRLLMINELTSQLIFMNLSGEMVKSIHFSEKEIIKNNIFEMPENEQISYRQATKALIRELGSRLEILNKQYQKMLKNRAADALAQIEDEKKARAALKRRFEEEKIRLAERRQQELRLEAERQAQLKLEEEQEAKKRFAIKGIYKKLTPGTMIAYLTENGNWREASLTLISNTTQRHIFSDNKGNKVLDPNKQEILALIGEQKIKILKQADNDFDPMQSLVKKRRQILQNL